ncbi:MAG: phage tail sheath family protein, partial [Oscillospiraceae bacterium]|nr:phage tail sheath family protein [Oscillospiraceae bacterium]
YNHARGTVVVTALTDIEAATASYDEADASLVDYNDIIGESTTNGEYTGIQSLTLLYQNENVVADLLAAPGWSHIPAVYSALMAASKKINGHWDAFVNADIPLVDGGNKIDTIDKARKWQSDNDYNAEFSKVYYPKVKDGSGRIFHLSTIGTATMMRVDLSHNSIPFESPSNKPITATSQYFGEESKNRGYDQQTANQLNEYGITTAVFWGGQWVLWGSHTAGYKYNGKQDVRANFDVNIRMLLHITNGFQLEHGTKIDEPMTSQDKDTILNIEQTKLDSLVSVGALIGNPVVKFLETENPVNNLINGDFVFDIAVTATPPFKSGTVRVVYTDEGFSGFFGGEQ